MVTSHFLVKLAHCSVQAHVSVLLVHVVNSCSWLILEHDTEGLDVVGSSFEDLVDWEDLSLCTLGLEESSQVVPEFAFGDDVVSCEQSEGIDFGIGVLFSGLLSSHDKELSDLRLKNKVLSFGVMSRWDLGFLWGQVWPFVRLKGNYDYKNSSIYYINKCKKNNITKNKGINISKIIEMIINDFNPYEK